MAKKATLFGFKLTATSALILFILTAVATAITGYGFYLFLIGGTILTDYLSWIYYILVLFLEIYILAVVLMSRTVLKT